ncbi:hypothetical protein HPB47_018255 [Ixodes persulcatus]|uniref:Uncharacterized protein n=1 Tax=Ixodes persulcatus TaxID=34615 RepID=A0AC60QL75_IXOPE|nr:hypothetical protein HPB47_018255 [Ixodes persulcatus]
MQRNFRSVRDIGVNSLKKILPQETSGEVKETDYLCQHCFLYFKAEIQSAPESSDSGGDAFIPESEAVDKLNRYVLPTKVSPLKPPSQVASRCRESYGKRKQAEIEEAVVSDVRTEIQTAYGTSDVSGPSQDKCNTCSEWMTNFRLAYAACASHQERCRLLTLLPPSLTRKEIECAVPEATRYLINKSRKLRDDHGVWSTPHPYSRCKHQATLHNLRQPASMAIQNGQDMSRILSQHLKGVKLIYLDETELVEFRNRKKEEWSNVRAVRGIQKWHVWRSRRTGQNSELTVFRTAESATTITIS